MEQDQINPTNEVKVKPLNETIQISKGNLRATLYIYFDKKSYDFLIENTSNLSHMNFNTKDLDELMDIIQAAKSICEKYEVDTL